MNNGRAPRTVLTVEPDTLGKFHHSFLKGKIHEEVCSDGGCCCRPVRNGSWGSIGLVLRGDEPERQGLGRERLPQYGCPPCAAPVCQHNALLSDLLSPVLPVR